MNTDCRNTLFIAGAAAMLMAITMGSRSSFGLFVSPLNTATGLGVITISFAGAVNHLLWGAAQPFVGALADRHGPARVIVTGALLLALGTAMVPFADTGPSLVFSFSLIAIAGAATGSNAILLGVVSRRVSVERRGLAVGIVGAGGSAGQLVLGPTTQEAISAAGWSTAMFALAALALLALPLALAFRMPRVSNSLETPPPRGPLLPTLAHPMFLCVAGGFFVCGFHVSFLLAHMPGVIALCGLPASTSGIWIAIVGLCNIVGSIASGMWIRRGSMRRALITLYALRAIGVSLFILLPKTEAVVLGFAAWMGLTYMATLPPTSGLIGRMFGLERLATLLGVIMLAHQLGAFLGVWLGGVALALSGSYDWIWYADIALALTASALHLPVREHPVAETTTPRPSAEPAAAAA